MRAAVAFLIFSSVAAEANERAREEGFCETADKCSRPPGIDDTAQ